MYDVDRPYTHFDVHLYEKRCAPMSEVVVYAIVTDMTMLLHL